MEVGRRSLSSKNEFRERSSRKKRGALPLAMILSFNDKEVHPDCPNSSNPYHKCGLHCLDEIPSGKNFLHAVRSDGDRELGKKSEKKGVNTNCPHASNPYHECAEYCLEKLSDKRQDAIKDHPGMFPKKEKKEVFTTERRVKPACINASNPYHVCAEYCFQTVPKKDQPGQSMRLKGSKEGEKVLNTKEKTGFHLQCKHASNPNHKCIESCFQSVPERNVAEGEKPKGVSNKTNKSSVHLNGNASSHNKVIEYCFEDTPKKEHLKGDMKPKKENEIDVITQRGFSSECKNASNPHHVCVEYCFQSVPEREQHGKALKLEEESEIIVTVEQRVNLEYKNASNRSHVCPEYCSESVPERDRHEQVIRSKSTKEGDQSLNNRPRTGFDPQCKHASKPHHECTEFCFQNAPDMNLLTEEEKPKGDSFQIDKSGALSNRKHVSNPYHDAIEDCFDDNLEKEHPNGAMKPKEERMAVTAKRVNLVCKYASNPNHQCTEYCFQNLPIKDRRGKAMMKSKEEKKVVASPQVVNFDCKYASNPYHVCADYCFENVLERDPPRQTIKKLKEEEMVVLPSERRVRPECKFASNPYHVCAEYCFQNALESEQRGQVTKLKSLKELKNLVSNKKITSGHPQCEYAANPYHQCAEYCYNKNMPGSKIPDGVMKTNERKKEKSYAVRRDDNLKYKNASNSFHRFAEYCPEEISPKNEAVEGSTATVKEKNRNSSKENKRNHPIIEKISLNSKYMEASKLSHNYIESAEGIILQDGTEKSSMDSKYVEAFNSTNNNFNLKNRISMYMQEGTKDLQSANVVDKKNSKEPTEVPPLHIEASDLFHEWCKYCSQTNVADDEIVKQEMKVGEYTRRNSKGDGFLKHYDSANMEKVQARGGFPRSLSISFLFLLGFLLALLHWTRVIHPSVMSLEKNEEPEKMKHERQLDPR